MPPHNLTATPSCSVGGKALFTGLLCTLPSSTLSFDGKVTDSRIEANLDEKRKEKTSSNIDTAKAFNEALKNEPREKVKGKKLFNTDDKEAFNEALKNEPREKVKGKKLLDTDDKEAFNEALKNEPRGKVKGKKLLDTDDKEAADNVSKKKPLELPLYIHDKEALDMLLGDDPGRICVVKKTSEESASMIKKAAMESDPTIAAKVKALDAQGIHYAIEVRPKVDVGDDGREGALGVWDATGLDEGSPVYRQVLKNCSTLEKIESVCPKQVAAVKGVLTAVGNLAKDTPQSVAGQFKYFVDEVSAVLSVLEETNAPKELLLCAVPAVFAKYKSEYWDGVMELAGEEAGKELQACADEILDPQHINNYLEFTEKARWAPPGPSRQEFNAAFGLLSKVDQGTTSAFRDLIVYLHDTVKPRVDSLDENRALRVNQEGLRDEEIKFQINQLDICTRNYLQCFHSIGQKFARIKDIKDMSVPDKKAQLQAVMREQISEVHWKFWPALKTSLDKLCDPSVVKDIESKVQTLTEQLSDAQSATVKDSSYMSRLWSLAKSFMGADDGVKRQDINGKDDDKALSPMFFDLLKIVEQLETYGQVASSSPEESPHLPDTIEPGDRVAICGALGYVSKPKAAALFTILNRLQALLESFPFRATASPEELASIEKFLNVDYHIVEAMEKEGHSFGVHGGLNVEECNKIMTSTFERYFKDCWSHVAAVLEGGDQEEAAKVFEGMATGILKWKDREQELDSGKSRIIEIIKNVGGINIAWYLAGMLQFVQGAVKPSDIANALKSDTVTGKWYPIIQDTWTKGFCHKLKPGPNHLWILKGANGDPALCLPTDPKSVFGHLDAGTEQALGSNEEFHAAHPACFEGWFTKFVHGLFGGHRAVEETGESWIDYTHDGYVWRLDRKLEKFLIRSKINPSCHSAFKARWYDASNQVIKSLCDEAIRKNLDDYDPLKESPNQLLQKKYAFKLLTGFEGPNFKSGVENSNYQGFIMCLDAKNPDSERVMDTISNPRHVLDEVLAQRRCEKKTNEGRKRSTDIFYTTATIEHDGKIYIENSHHRGYIGACYPSLVREIESRKPREIRSDHNATVEGIDQTMPLKEIIEAFVKAEKDGQVKVNKTYGNFVGEENDTFNWTQAMNSVSLDPRVSGYIEVGKPLEGCVAGGCVLLGTLMSYLPYVAGAVGAVGSVIGAKKLWNRYKARPDKQYAQVSGTETSAV